MYRKETVEEISDGKLYTANDMVKIGTGDCRGCSDCCRMGPVIVLDPLDAFELNRFLQQSIEDLLNDTIELKVIDGLILPVLKLVPETRSISKLDDTMKHRPEKGNASEEPMICPYLDENGRCSIHAFRPGICRLYPLGRSWEGGDFRYILQVNECGHCNGTKVKIKKWLGIPDLGAYEAFCRDWHDFLDRTRHLLDGTAPEGRLTHQVCIYVLQQFYLCDWNVDDFYAAFAGRRTEAMHHLGWA